MQLGWAGGGQTSHVVDGGLGSEFPIGVFDRGDGRPPRWPTFGVKLGPAPVKLSQRRSANAVAHPIDGLRSFATAVFETAISGNDQSRLADPCVAARPMFVDNLGLPSTKFELDGEGRDRLYRSGYDAGRRFPERWDWPAYSREGRGF